MSFTDPILNNSLFIQTQFETSFKNTPANPTTHEIPSEPKGKTKIVNLMFLFAALLLGVLGGSFLTSNVLAAPSNNHGGVVSLPLVGSYNNADAKSQLEAAGISKDAKSLPVSFYGNSSADSSVYNNADGKAAMQSQGVPKNAPVSKPTTINPIHQCK